MLTTIATAIGLFVATNLDDIVVLTLLFVASTRGGLRARSVVAGQYLGFIALVGLSAIAALGLTIVPDEWVGLLGLIPMAIGVHALIRTLRHAGGDDEEGKPTPNGTHARSSSDPGCHAPLWTATPGSSIPVLTSCDIQASDGGFLRFMRR